MRGTTISIALMSAPLLALLACEDSPSSPGADARADQRTAAAGTISLYIPVDSFAPAAGVPIAVFDAASQAAVASGRTDAQGEYSASVDEGLYDVVMTVPQGLYLAPHARDRAEDVRVTANVTVQVHGFALSAQRPAARVSGQTVVEGLGPVPGTLLTLRGSDQEFQRTSDAAGNFDFGTVDPGPWELTIAPSAGYTLADGQTSPHPLPPLANGDGISIQISLATADGTGRLHILALADSAIIGGVAMSVRDAGGEEVAAGTTSQGGQASFVLLRGTYRLEVTPPAGHVLEDGAVQNVEIRAGRVSAVVVMLRRQE